MGLCKCPKRRLTNQFCFDHRVNVCENCMVTGHPKCIVKSYLQWLQDSDFNSICTICNSDLSVGDCVRLVCYHVFHWSCLESILSQLPPTTAPAGYKCSECATGIFPSTNLISPVADALRERLKEKEWARLGLGLPLIEDNVPPSIVSPPAQQQPTNGRIEGAQNSQHGFEPDFIPFVDTPTRGATTARRNVDFEFFKGISLRSPLLTDHDEDKYQRRGAVEWFKRLFRNPIIRWMWPRQDPLVSTRSSIISSPVRRSLLRAVAVIFFFVFLIFMFSILGRNGEDPALDPMNNPHIRVEGNGVKT